jgi:hypothetical protein
MEIEGERGKGKESKSKRKQKEIKQSRPWEKGGFNSINPFPSMVYIITSLTVYI